MTVKKQFAQDGGDLDGCMDQLIEVLAQLLDEPVSAPNPGAAPPAADLHSGNDRVIHVVVQNPNK
jgi:hypothetical protein